MSGFPLARPERERAREQERREKERDDYIASGSASRLRQFSGICVFLNRPASTAVFERTSVAVTVVKSKCYQMWLCERQKIPRRVFLVGFWWRAGNDR